MTMICVPKTCACPILAHVDETRNVDDDIKIYSQISHHHYPLTAFRRMYVERRISFVATNAPGLFAMRHLVTRGDSGFTVVIDISVANGILLKSWLQRVIPSVEFVRFPSSEERENNHDRRKTRNVLATRQNYGTVPIFQVHVPD